MKNFEKFIDQISNSLYVGNTSVQDKQKEINNGAMRFDECGFYSPDKIKEWLLTEVDEPIVLSELEIAVLDNYKEYVRFGDVNELIRLQKLGNFNDINPNYTIGDILDLAKNYMKK